MLQKQNSIQSNISNVTASTVDTTTNEESSDEIQLVLVQTDASQDLASPQAKETEVESKEPEDNPYLGVMFMLAATLVNTLGFIFAKVLYSF